MISRVFEERVEGEEGLKLTAYLDSTGNWTIGYGHHDATVHPGMVWTEAKALAQLDADIQSTIDALDASPVFGWWVNLDPARADVILDMAFNMGLATFSTFGTFLGLVKSQQFAQAADDGLKTLWAKQVGDRAVRLMTQLRDGVEA